MIVEKKTPHLLMLLTQDTIGNKGYAVDRGIYLSWANSGASASSRLLTPLSLGIKGRI